MTQQELNDIQALPEEVTVEQVRVSGEELETIREANNELIEIEEKTIEDGKALDSLFENENFLHFVDMYTKEEAERISEAITSTSSLTNASLSTLQGMQMGIRYFKLFLIAKQNESHGAVLRLEARIADRQKIDNGDVFKEVGEVE